MVKTAVAAAPGVVAVDNVFERVVHGLAPGESLPLDKLYVYTVVLQKAECKGASGRIWSKMNKRPEEAGKTGHQPEIDYGRS